MIQRPDNVGDSHGEKSEWRSLSAQEKESEEMRADYYQILPEGFEECCACEGSIELRSILRNDT